MSDQSSSNSPGSVSPVTGLVLAGGRARRFHHQDKGLIMFNQQSLVEYALHALQQVANPLLINANRNLPTYQAFGYQVISDADDSFAGPLAGVLSGMQHAHSELLLTVPCDCPMIHSGILQRMIDCLHEQQADCCIPDDGERVHPVFLLVKTALQDDLAQYLASGERKIDRWLQQHRLVQVDVSDQPQVFVNINTPEELQRLELNQ